MADLSTDERGFTLVEVLVATLLMVMVLMALYALFDMSLRVYGIGNSEVETNEQARVALERMEREIRNAKCDASGCLQSQQETSIRLVTQNGDGTAEPVNYAVEETDGHYYLKRDTGTLATLGSTEDFVDPSTGEVEFPLKFAYRDSSYACPVLNAFHACTDIPPNDIAMVEITLEVEDGGRTQTLNTVAGLRNAP